MIYPAMRAWEIAPPRKCSELNMRRTAAWAVIGYPCYAETLECNKPS